MTQDDNLNPLFSGQRERSGSDTFRRYAYQYHYALYRAVTEHAKGGEYAVFVELHEDVVLADSLNYLAAKFEFNQVKTSQKLKEADLTRRAKGSGSSILGKVLQGHKKFKTSIKEVNLVCSNGFELALKDQSIQLRKIPLSQVHDNTVIAFRDALRIEFADKTLELPTELTFIIPDLQDQNFQPTLIGEISQLVSTLFPGSHCDAVSIYRALYDELERKGQVTYDILKWDETLSIKALTSRTVGKTIAELTSLKDAAAVDQRFHAISQELGYNVITGKKLSQAFLRYRHVRLGDRSVHQAEITNKLARCISQQLSEGTTEMSELIQKVKQCLPAELASNFPNAVDLEAAIICEFIQGS